MLFNNNVAISVYSYVSSVSETSSSETSGQEIAFQLKGYTSAFLNPAATLAGVAYSNKSRVLKDLIKVAQNSS